MKITVLLIFVVVAYIALATKAERFEKTGKLKQVNVAGQRRNILIRSRQKRQFQDLLKLPSIICYYAKYGRWPNYEANLRPLVLSMSRLVFSMTDESIRYYCTQINSFNQFFRPNGTTTSSPRLLTRSTISSSGQRGFLIPTTSTFRPSFFTQTTSTPRPSSSTSTTTSSPTSTTTRSSTTTTTAFSSSLSTTTTQAPSVSDSGSASASASG